MYCFRSLLALIILIKLSSSASPGPYQAASPEQLAGPNPKRPDAAAGFVGVGVPANVEPPDCSPGGECDCSIIKDKNSEKQVPMCLLYFQCITNAACEPCWNPNFPTPTSTPSTTINYQTMPPGTYTETLTDGVHIIIVTEVTATTSATTK
ncbi:hypothetical protein G7046_g9192 [Stylonectria norvegica]|nr:hypothetical protein G7046_g9192 [Stylonectria norvegica]